MIDIDISVRSDLWTETSEQIEQLISEAASKTLDVSGQNGAHELSIVLADNAFIRQLNKEWRGKDKPTNVLSFPQGEPELLGDVILAHETIATEAEEQNKAFADHLKHLVVHGVLHLLGHDHEEDDEAETMERLEIEILGHLGVKNPYEITNSVS